MTLDYFQCEKNKPLSIDLLGVKSELKPKIPRASTRKLPFLIHN